MSDSIKDSFWHTLKLKLRELKEEMYRNSVAAAGPSDDSCCHRPVDELELKREEYRRIAREKRQSDRA